MSRSLKRRLDAVESHLPRVELERSPAQRRAAVAVVARIEACLVAFYLGGWQPGEDAVACVKNGISATHSRGQNVSLMWAAYSAEYAFSGVRGVWHTSERLTAAFHGIGDDRYPLYDELDDIFALAHSIGDPLLCRIALNLPKDDQLHHTKVKTDLVRMTHCVG